MELTKDTIYLIAGFIGKFAGVLKLVSKLWRAGYMAAVQSLPLVYNGSQYLRFPISYDYAILSNIIWFNDYIIYRRNLVFPQISYIINFPSLTVYIELSNYINPYEPFLCGFAKYNKQKGIRLYSMFLTSAFNVIYTQKNNKYDISSVTVTDPFKYVIVTDDHYLEILFNKIIEIFYIPPNDSKQYQTFFGELIELINIIYKLI